MAGLGGSTNAFRQSRRQGHCSGRRPGSGRYVVEKRITTAGEVLSEQKRGGPSTIVYTPAGYVGVHFLPINTKPTPFTGDVPTPEEARAAVQGYIGYYGSLTVYPGQVFHNLMSAMSNIPGTILRRFARVLEGRQRAERSVPARTRPAGADGGDLGRAAPHQR